MERINQNHPEISDLYSKLVSFVKSEEVDAGTCLKNERLQLDKRKERDQSEDKVHNLLLNVIEYSFLKKDKQGNIGGAGIQSVIE